MAKQLQLFDDLYKHSPPRAKGLRQGLRRFFFGDDIFISYSRADAGKYAMALAVKMSERGYLCFLDQFGTDVNRNVPESLKEKVRSSTALVLIGTEGAASSRYVREEVEIFKESGRPIHPISIDPALPKAAWPELDGLSWIPELRRQMELGEPSADTIAQLKNSSRYRRRNQWLRLSLVGGFSLLALVILASTLGSYFLITDARAQASVAAMNEREATMNAKSAAMKEKEATHKEAAATLNERLARGEAVNAQIQAGEAIKTKNFAVEQQELAEAGMRRAQELERKATEHSEAAKRQEQGSRASLIAREPGKEFLALTLAQEAARPEFASRRTPSEQVIRGLTTSVNAVDYSFPLEDAPGEIRLAQISPDGRKVFGTIYDKRRDTWGLVLWDTRTGKLTPFGDDIWLDEEFGQPGPVAAVSFSRDSSRLMINGELWNVGGERPTKVETKCDVYLRAALDAGGERIINLLNNMWACEIASGKKEPLVLPRHFYIGPARSYLKRELTDVAFTPAGEPTIYGHFSDSPDSPEKVRAAVYFPETGRSVEIKTPEGRFAGFGDNGSIIMLGKGSGERGDGFASEAYIQSPDGYVQTLSGYKGSVASVSVVDGRARVVTVNGNHARVADARPVKDFVALRAHNQPLHSILFAAGGKSVLTVGSDKLGRVWEASSGSLLRTLPLPHTLSPDIRDELKAFFTVPDLAAVITMDNAALSSDGTRVVTADGNKVKVWDVNTGPPLCTAPQSDALLRAFSFVGGNDFAVTNGDDDDLIFLDVRTCRQIAFTLDGKEKGSAAADGRLSFFERDTFSPDGAAMLATTSNLSTNEGWVLKLWDLPKVDSLREAFAGSALKKEAVQLAPAKVWKLPREVGFLFASWVSGGVVKALSEGKDRSLRVWRPDVKRPLPLEGGGRPGLAYATFSGDGTRVATAYDDEVRVWDTDSGRLLIAFECSLDTKANTPIVLSPDGDRLVVAMKDHTARIFPASRQGFFEVAGRLSK